MGSRSTQLSDLARIEEAEFLARCDSSLDGGTIVAQGLHATSSLGWRLREELDLLKRQLGTFLLCVAVLVYGTMFVLLNLAFYRYPVDQAWRLKDLGHEVIPQISDDMMDSGLVDLPLNMCCLVAGVMLLFLFVNNASAGRRNPKPHFVNVVLRGGAVYAIGHVLRACCYLTTSVPGSANRCLSTHVPPPKDFQPKSFAECFYTAADVYHNCGDLMYSGHMLLMLVLTLAVYRYGEASFWISHRQNTVLVGFCVFLCVAESILILSARHHYTSDVVVAWYITPLLWYYYNTVISVRDLKPDLERIARSVLGHDQQSAHEDYVSLE